MIIVTLSLICLFLLFLTIYSVIHSLNLEEKVKELSELIEKTRTSSRDEVAHANTEMHTARIQLHSANERINMIVSAKDAVTSKLEKTENLLRIEKESHDRTRSQYFASIERKRKEERKKQLEAEKEYNILDILLEE